MSGEQDDPRPHLLGKRLVCQSRSLDLCGEVYAVEADGGLGTADTATPVHSQDRHLG